jgi:hypothetical protein
MPLVALRTYPDRPTAWRASLFLMEEGVLARPHDVLLGVMPGIDRDQPYYEHWVAIAFPQDAEHARALLDEFDATPRPDDADWAHETEPDLSRLPPGLTVPCVGCKHDLRPLVPASPADEIRCPACGVVNDPVRQVIQRHGPEALIDCYPDDEPEDPEWTQEAVIRRLHLPCPHCRCPLHALPLTGECPACRKSYSKPAIVRHAFDAP